MENKDLQKAISQIKFPVRYDETLDWIMDADDVLLFDNWTRNPALCRKVAEMINGLNDNGK